MFLRNTNLNPGPIQTYGFFSRDFINLSISNNTIFTMPNKLKKPPKRIGSASSEAEDVPNKKTDFDHFEIAVNGTGISSIDRVMDTQNTTSDLSDDKKSKKQKKDIKKAFQSFKSKLTKKRSKNDVTEISIKPEAETPAECWANNTEPASAKSKGRKGSSKDSSRSSSANSKGSTIPDIPNIEDLDDGIPVVYDAAYHGGDAD